MWEEPGSTPASVWWLRLKRFHGDVDHIYEQPRPLVPRRFDQIRKIASISEHSAHIFSGERYMRRPRGQRCLHPRCFRRHEDHRCLLARGLRMQAAHSFLLSPCIRKQPGPPRFARGVHSKTSALHSKTSALHSNAGAVHSKTSASLKESRAPSPEAAPPPPDLPGRRSDAR